MFLYDKVWIIKNETISDIENSIISIIFGQSILNSVKITISLVIDVAGKTTWSDKKCGLDCPKP